MAKLLTDVRRKTATAIVLTVLPICAIFAARIATHSALAAEYPRASALLFLWVAADALALSAIAKAPNFRPGVKALLGAFAFAAIAVPLAAAPPVRDEFLAMPALMIAMMATILLYAGWSVARAVITFRATASFAVAASEILPAKLVHLRSSELEMMHLALFRWNAPVDVPQHSVAFEYHRYLTPMIVAFLVLQLIELSIVHFLVSLWNENAAYILLALSVWGVIWMVALLKSFRIKPVLLTLDGIQVRSGSMVDAFVPYANILGIVGGYDAERLKQRSTLNCAIMSAPNVCIDLREPIAITTFFGRSRMIDSVALRLDDSAGFHCALRDALR
jgi:hypothetical protein